MGYMAYLKDIVTVVSVLSLFATGLFITLKSGVMAVEGHPGRMLLGNLSRLVITLAACLLFLTIVQQVIGFRLGLF